MKEARNNDLRMDLRKEDWYVYDENYGTDEEKYLVRFIKMKMAELVKTYSEIYLLRNESLFQIYRFSDGRPLEPDFVLFLKDRKTSKMVSYQLFIESKNEALRPKDQWKEDFLLQIEDAYKIEILNSDDQYKIIGLPFFQEDKKAVFIEEFDKKLI